MQWITLLGAIDIKFKCIFTWCTYPIMKVLVLLINNPPFTTYTTLTPHNEHTGLYVMSHIAYAYTAIEQRTPRRVWLMPGFVFSYQIALACIDILGYSWDTWSRRKKMTLWGKKKKKKSALPGRESNPGLPRDRRRYLPLYYRGLACMDS